MSPRIFFNTIRLRSKNIFFHGAILAFFIICVITTFVIGVYGFSQMAGVNYNLDISTSPTDTDTSDGTSINPGDPGDPDNSSTISNDPTDDFPTSDDTSSSDDPDNDDNQFYNFASSGGRVL